MAMELVEVEGCERLLSGLVATSPPIPLLKKAAKEAFYKLGITFLMALAKYFFVPLPPRPTLWVVLLALVKHFAEPADDEELLAIMSKRLVLPTMGCDVEVSEKDAQEAIEPGDLNQFDDINTQEKKRKAETDVYKEDFAQLFKKVRPKAAAKKKADPPAALFKKKKPLPDDTMDATAAAGFVPPGCSIGKDEVRCRWYTRDDSIGANCERTWKRWGDAGAFALVVQNAWDAIATPNPFQWITKLAQEAQNE